MPRAGPLNFTDPKEIAFSANFVVETAPSAGIKLTAAADGSVTSANASYYCVPALGDNGRLTFDLKLPLYDSRTPQWLAVVDAVHSEVHLIRVASFDPQLVKSATSPHAGLRTETYQSSIRVFLMIDWGTHAGLICKTFDAKMDGEKFDDARRVALAIPEKFVHLHNHSVYSMLDGASTIEGMVRRAVHNGQPGLALTDHGNMFGSWKFYQACREHEIKSILGVEAYLVDDVNVKYQHEGKDRRFEYHQTILAMNQTGWENLCAMVSIAGRDNFYHVPRIDHTTLFKHSEGLIVLSGCFKGPVAWHLQEFEKPLDGSVLPSWCRTDPNRSRSIMRKYKQVLGDRYYAEVHSNDFARYMKAMPSIVQMAREEGVPVVVAGDCHYEVTEDAAFQAMTSRISSNKIDEIGDASGQKSGPYFISSRSEIDPVGVLEPHMFDRTLEIMDRCKVEFPKGFLFPKYPVQQDVDWTDFQASELLKAG